MGYRQMWLALRPYAFRPEENVEIERPGLPRLATACPAEMRLYILQPLEKGRRGEGRCQNGCGIRILPPRWAHRRAGYHCRLREDVYVVHFERGNGLVEYLVRAAYQGERLVRSQADEVEIGQTRYPQPNGRKAAVGDHGKSPCLHGARGLDPDRMWQSISRFRYRRDRKRHRPIRLR